MALSKETLALLGLSENATDEEVSAKVAELNSAKTKAEGDRDKFKKSFDTTSSELANLKKAQMTEDEKTKADIEEMKNRLAEAEKKNTLNDLEKQYLGVGMSNEDATAMANAVLEGNFLKQGEIMASFKSKVANEAKVEALRGQPNPNQGDPDKMADAKYTKENFLKGLISVEDMNALKERNPEKYKEIIG